MGFMLSNGGYSWISPNVCTRIALPEAVGLGSLGVQEIHWCMMLAPKWIISTSKINKVPSLLTRFPLLDLSKI